MISAKIKIITVAVILCAVVCVNAQKFGDKIKKPNASDNNNNNNTDIKNNDNNNNNSNAKNNSNASKEVAVSASQPKRKQQAVVVGTNNAGKRPSDKKKHANNNKGFAEVKVYQYSMSHSDESDDLMPLNQQQTNYGVDPRDFDRQFRLITSSFPKTAASDHNYQIPIYKAPNPPRAPNAPKVQFVERHHFQDRHDDNHQQKQHHQQQPQHQQQHHRQHDNHQQQYRQQQPQHDNYHPNHNYKQHDNHHQNHHHHNNQQQQQQHHDSHHQQNHHQNHHQQQQQQQRHHQQHNNHDQNNLHHQHNHKNNRNNNHNTIQTNSGLSFDIPRGFPHPNDDKRAKFQKKLMGEQNRKGKPWGAQMSYTYRDPKNPKNYVEVKEMHVNVNKENAMTPQESANQLQKLLQASQGNTYGLFASRPFDGQNPVFGGRPGNIVNDDFYADNDDVDHDEPRFPF